VLKLVWKITWHVFTTHGSHGVSAYASCAIRTVRSQCQSQWERPNFAPSPSQKPLNQFGWLFKYITMSAQRGGFAKFGGNRLGRYKSARVCVKKRVSVWIFCWHIHLSIYPCIPCFVGATGHIFGTNLTHNDPNDVFSQASVLLCVSMTHFVM